MEKVGPHTHVAGEELEGYLGCKTPSPRSMRSETHAGIPNTKQQRHKEDSTWWWKSVGIQSAWERRESAKDPDAVFPRPSTPIVNTRLESALSSFQLLVTLICHTRVLQRDLLAALSRDLGGGGLFFWRSSWWRLRQWLNCEALERGPFFPTSSTQPALPSHLHLLDQSDLPCWVQPWKGLEYSTELAP